MAVIHFKKDEAFSERMDMIFDIARRNAQVLIKIPEDWAFLIALTEGREGYMAG